MVEPDAGVRHQDERIFLKHRGDGDDRNVLRGRVKGLDQIGAEVEINFSGRQQQLIVGLRAALQNRDVEAVSRVSAVGERLIEAAMFGFGEPVGREGDFIALLVERPGGDAEREGYSETKDERENLSHCGPF